MNFKKRLLATLLAATILSSVSVVSSAVTYDGKHVGGESNIVSEKDGSYIYETTYNGETHRVVINDPDFNIEAMEKIIRGQYSPTPKYWEKLFDRYTIVHKHTCHPTGPYQEEIGNPNEWYVNGKLAGYIYVVRCTSSTCEFLGQGINFI